MKKLINQGYDANIIGGAVRDHYLGHEPKDYDLFTNANGEQIMEVFKGHRTSILGGPERQEKILTIIVDSVEISQYRSSPDRLETGTSLEEHCKSCDFSMNAMICDVNGKIIDYHDGRSHLYSRILCAVGDPKHRINEDKLRALRAIRFASKLNYDLDEIEYKLRLAINKVDISSIPAERLREEILKIFQYKKGPRMLHNNHLLEKIIPGIPEMRNMDGGKHHNESPIEHMFSSYDFAHSLTDDAVLKLIIFLHDIGKKETCEEIDGNNTFHMHEHIGAKIIVDIFKKLKFSTKDINRAHFLIKNHMFNKRAGDKPYRKLFAEMEEAKINIYDLILLHYCDNQANLKRTRKSYQYYLRTNTILKKYFEMKYSKDPFTTKDLKINGHDVMAILKVPQGKIIGDTLKEALQVIDDGQMKNNRAELMSWLRNKVAE